MIRDSLVEGGAGEVANESRMMQVAAAVAAVAAAVAAAMATLTST